MEGVEANKYDCQLLGEDWQKMSICKNLVELHTAYEQAQSTDKWLDLVEKVMPMSDLVVDIIVSEPLDGFEVSSSFLERITPHLVDSQVDIDTAELLKIIDKNRYYKLQSYQR